MYWLIALSMCVIAAIIIFMPLFKHKYGSRKNILIISILSICIVILSAYFLMQGRPVKQNLAQSNIAENMVNPNTNSAAVNLNDINNLAALLTDKLDKKPKDASGWALLARTYFKMKRYRESLPAFEKASEMDAGNAQLLSDFADALAMSNGGYFDTYAATIVDKALAANSENIKALLLKATIHFNNKDYTKAIQIWEKLLAKQDINDGVKIEATNGINEARQLMLSNS